MPKVGKTFCNDALYKKVWITKNVKVRIEEDHHGDLQVDIPEATEKCEADLPAGEDKIGADVAELGYSRVGSGAERSQDSRKSRH